jgi:hypothetical protein
MGVGYDTYRKIYLHPSKPLRKNSHGSDVMTQMERQQRTKMLRVVRPRDVAVGQSIHNYTRDSGSFVNKYLCDPPCLVQICN